MSTPVSPAYQAVNLAGATWRVGTRTASFAAARPGFGVRHVVSGEVLSSGDFSDG